MNDQRSSSPDITRLVTWMGLFLGGALLAILTGLAWVKGLDGNVGGSAALAKVIVETGGFAAPLLLGVGLLVIGAMLFLVETQLGVRRHLLGLLGAAVGMAVLLGAVREGSGGALGDVTGGAVTASFGSWLGVPFGLAALLVPLWFAWLQAMLPPAGEGAEGARSVWAEKGRALVEAMARPPIRIRPEADSEADSGASSEKLQGSAPTDAQESDGEGSSVSVAEATALASEEDDDVAPADATEVEPPAPRRTTNKWIRKEQPQAAPSTPLPEPIPVPRSPYPEDVRRTGGIPEGAQPLNAPAKESDAPVAAGESGQEALSSDATQDPKRPVPSAGEPGTGTQDQPQAGVAPGAHLADAPDEQPGAGGQPSLGAAAAQDDAAVALPTPLTAPEPFKAAESPEVRPLVSPLAEQDGVRPLEAEPPLSGPPRPSWESAPEEDSVEDPLADPVEESAPDEPEVATEQPVSDTVEDTIQALQDFVDGPAAPEAEAAEQSLEEVREEAELEETAAVEVEEEAPEEALTESAAEAEEEAEYEEADDDESAEYEYEEADEYEEDAPEAEDEEESDDEEAEYEGDAEYEDDTEYEEVDAEYEEDDSEAEEDEEYEYEEETDEYEEEEADGDDAEYEEEWEDEDADPVAEEAEEAEEELEEEPEAAAVADEPEPAPEELLEDEAAQEPAPEPAPTPIEDAPAAAAPEPTLPAEQELQKSAPAPEEQPATAATPKIEPAPSEAPAAAAAPQGGEDLLFQAGLLFLERGHVAVSLLQRGFSLDFDQACEVLDQLQERGLIGPYVGGQQREIRMTQEQWLEAMQPDA